MHSRIISDILGVLSFGFNSNVSGSDDLTELLFIGSNLPAFLTSLSVRVLLHFPVPVSPWSWIPNMYDASERFVPERNHVFQVIPPRYLLCALLQPTRCDHCVRMELLTTPTKAQCAAVNLSPPTHHISPCYPAPPPHTSTLFILRKSLEWAGLGLFVWLSETEN